MGLFGVTGSNKWRATPGSHLEESHPGDRLLACVMSFLIGNVWCKYQVWCPWEMSAPLSGSRFLLHFLNSSGEIGGVPNYLKMIWETCRKWECSKKGQKLNFASEGSLILALLVLLSHRACLCTGCAKESRCSEYSVPLNGLSFLPTCLLRAKGPMWPAGQTPAHIMQRTWGCV